jgi:hypothetical protein
MRALRPIQAAMTNQAHERAIATRRCFLRGSETADIVRGREAGQAGDKRRRGIYMGNAQDTCWFLRHAARKINVTINRMEGASSVLVFVAKCFTVSASLLIWKYR